MNWRKEWYKLAAIMGGFGLLYFLSDLADLLPGPVPRFGNPFYEALWLTHAYAREHVLTSLLPAFFLAGAIGVFVRQASVLRYLGPRAHPVTAYGVSAVSGGILAACSCAVLPMFAGIYRMGAGLGPACTFLYSGPAISVLAIVMTWQVLGWRLGAARAIGAMGFSLVIGLLMHLAFRREDNARAAAMAELPAAPPSRPLWQNLVFFACLVGILAFGNSCNCRDKFWAATGIMKWQVAAACAVVLGVVLVRWFKLAWWKAALTAAAAVAAGLAPWGNPTLAYAAAAVGLSVATATDKGQAGEWFAATWMMAKQIMPLLLAGVLAAGFLLGQPAGGEGLIPARYVKALVGADSGAFLALSGWTGSSEGLVRVLWPVWTNFFAAVFGAFMYFATLTEVPIVQGLLGAGLGKGPSLALLLAGPALSLPSMLVIRGILGTRKTVVYIGLVVLTATIAGLVYDRIS